MKLLTKAIKEKLIRNHKSQDGSKDFKVVCKLFNPTGAGTWYLTELDPETNIAFGLCSIHEPELGYVSIDELIEFRGRFGLGIERDSWFPADSYTLEQCREKEMA